MMFSNRFVCSVKVNGKILREQSNLVTLPFGSEYTILLKNINSRRSMVKVSVDGQDATEGTRLILAPNSTLELERFIRNGNLNTGNRFKFIERTAGIEAHRGIKVDDGLIRAEFWAEKEVAEETIIRRKYVDEYYPVPRPYYPPYDPYWPRPWRRRYDEYPYSQTICNTETTTTGGTSSFTVTSTLGDNFQKSCQMNVPNTSSNNEERGGPINFQSAMNVNMASFNDAGITVPGSESSQHFHSASGFPLESNSTVIVLQLRGEVGGVAVEAPVTVERKPECSTCGKVNKAVNKFCSECGTALQLI